MRIRFQKRAANASKKAFTIIEVIVSVLIIAIGVAGFMGAFNYAFFVVELARENQRATQILVDKCDTIRLYNWDQVNSNGFIPSAPFAIAYDPTTNATGSGIYYTCTVTVASFPYSASYAANMRQLTIKLDWVTRKKIPHSRTNYTFIAKDGLQNYVY